MRMVMIVVLSAVLTLTGPNIKQAAAAALGLHEVVGVEDDDMLKLRAGPGTGYDVIVGLPNGTELRVHNCERIGKARWCSVSLQRARGLKGYVSATYLRKM